MAKKKSAEAENLQELESALTRSEQFIEDNQKIIMIVLGTIILLVILYLGVRRFYLEPEQEEASTQMFMAQNYFEKDSFNLALNGDGNYLGFLDIIDEYGFTKSANLANYYAGMSYLHLGNYDEAIDFLSDFDTDDLLLGPITKGAKGDAYLELGEQDKALSNYKSAYKMNDNEFTAPIYMVKAANLLIAMEEIEEAADIYRELKEKFPESSEGRNADKYISNLELQLNKN